MRLKFVFLLLICLLKPFYVCADLQTTISSEANVFVLGDISTQTIIAKQNESKRINPGSLTRLMTIYVIFDAIKTKKLYLRNTILISKTAITRPGPRMFLTGGEKIRISDLVEGLVIYGATDATLALIEILSGNESNFVSRMNKMTKQIGLQDSRFTSAFASTEKGHFSTAMDLYILSWSIVEDFPELYEHFQRKSKNWNGIEQYNSNNMLNRDTHTDGLIVDQTAGSGFLSSISAVREERRVLLIAGDTKNAATLIVESQKLVNRAFENYEAQFFFDARETLSVISVVRGVKDSIPAGTSSSVTATIKRQEPDNVRIEIESIQPLIAPVEKGDTVGQLTIINNQKLLKTYDLIALEGTAKAGLFSRGWKGLNRFVKDLFK